MAQGRVVLITGASSGIGQASARLLAERGFIVFGTSRNPSQVEPMAGVKVLPLDVRSDESVQACVSAVLEQAGRLDVLINNAGYALCGGIEEASLAEARAQFETNLFGVARMAQAVLPTMRRQGGGQVINISTLAGTFALPFAGYYSASKFALEGYTEALRHELRPLNIPVSLVEPGFVKSGFLGNTQYAAERIGEYDPWRQRAFAAIEEHMAAADEPAVVARCILAIVNSSSPKLRYAVGTETGRTVLMHRLLPAATFEQMVRGLLHLDAKSA